MNVMISQCHDGYFGKMSELTEITLINSTMIANFSFGKLNIGQEVDVQSALWRLKNAPEYRNWACNKFFKKSS